MERKREDQSHEQPDTTREIVDGKEITPPAMPGDPQRAEHERRNRRQ